MSVQKKFITKVSEKINANTPAILENERDTQERYRTQRIFKYFSELRKKNELMKLNHTESSATSQNRLSRQAILLEWKIE